ncbi:MAG TPA: YceD family protein [Candidatus Baltobacteraceae bacterium]|nr:YceD family protein [Candidatus Baltobacteraceae bacterium]
MSLKVNLRHLDEREIHLKGELPVKELDFDLRDEMIRTEKPLRYDLEIEKLHDSILVQGKLELTLNCECVRCLKPFQQKLKLDNWALHLPLEGAEKVSIKDDSIDLTPFVREDILLEFPQHPLCKTDCGGLKKSAKKPAAKQEKESAWAELNKLKLN